MDVAQALTKGVVRLPLWSQDSGEASAPARGDTDGLCYQARGALSRSRPELRVGAQEAPSCHPAGLAAARHAGSPFASERASSECAN